MPRKRVRRIESLISDAVRDLVFPTSVGLGLVVAGCGSSSGDSDGGVGPAEASIPADTGRDRGMDVPMWPILPPRFDAADTYAILPPAKDAGAGDGVGKEAGGNQHDGAPPIYAIMAPQRDAGEDRRRIVEPPIYAIMAPRHDAGKTDAPLIYPILPILPNKA